MQPKLRAILDDEVGRIFDHFRECLGVRISFFDTQGKLIRYGKGGKGAQFCSYCKLVRRLYGPGRCDADDQNAWERAQTQGMHSYTCHAGMIESVVPLYTNGCLIGYAMVGQIRTDKKLPDHVAEDWRAAYGDDGAIQKAFFEQELTSHQRLESVLSLFSVVANYIMANHLVSMNVSPLVINAINYMRENVTQPLSVQDLADQFAVSPSTLSHAFSRELGAPFKQIYIEMKLGRAEEVMREQPTTSVARVAESVGYEDPCYFTRLYKKHRGHPPKDFLDRMKGAGGANVAVQADFPDTTSRPRPFPTAKAP